MSRRALAIAVLVAASVAVVGGCQSYNFNPVGSCLYQPGQKQVKLADVTTADILFVVDDSNSMDPKQQALAQNFSTFIGSLAAAQAERAASALEPFDFHIAVTSSSIFRNYSGGALSTNFESPLISGCAQGVASPGAAYPQGNFVAYGSNPKVLHFTKDLAWSTCNPTTGVCTDPQINALIQQFVGTCSVGGALCSPTCSGSCTTGNVEVGSCGSGEEQHLQAGRLAMQKVLAGQQPGVTASEFPHVGAKLVVVWVGDEDDCSNDPSNPISLSGGPGNDSCVQDRSLPQAQQKLYPISSFSDYFAGLLAPPGQAPSAAHPYASLGAAFIVSSVHCADGTYEPADSCSASNPVAPGVCPVLPSASCNPVAPICSGAYSAGIRFLQLAGAFQGRSYDVIEGTVCEEFGPLLARIADLVKAPSTLRLSSLPAASEITVLRIVDAKGYTAKVCTQRTVAGSVTSPATAEGWWFAGCSDTNSVPAVASSPTLCIYINHQAALDPVNSCEANPGETYSAEYMGQMPAGGCPSATPNPAPSLFCAQALSGVPDAGTAEAEHWWCYGVSGAVGTCLCN